MTDDELAAVGVYQRDDRNAVAIPAPVTRADFDPPSTPPPFEPAPTRRHRAGWTAERQRLFIETLAETGCVSEACAAVGLSPRSAYKLRLRAGAGGFNEAWVHAETLAATRLTALAFERAIHGRSEYLFKDGILVAERRTPSDRLLMWLIAHLDPAGFGHSARHDSGNPRFRALDRLPRLLKKFRDVGEDACPTQSADLAPVAENEPTLPA